MYDPISGRGKIPAPDYSKTEWYQEWLQECRRADAYMGKAVQPTKSLDEQAAQLEKKLEALADARRMAYAMPDSPERRTKLRRISHRMSYLRNRKESLERQQEIDHARRAKQKAPQPAATEQRDKPNNTSRS